MFSKFFGKFRVKKAKIQESFDDSTIQTENEDVYPEAADEDEATTYMKLHKIFGNVTVKTVNREGLYLQASCPNAKILMEYYENDLLDFADGSNAYFFGNKLIIVTRWSNMTDAEKQMVETADLTLALHPYPCAQISLKIGKNWGDVIVNLHHCCSVLNDENAPVDEAIFIFADTQNTDYLSCRNVLLPLFVQKFLQRCNVNSHKFLTLDSKVQTSQMKLAEALNVDFYNSIYDECWKKTSQFYDKARASELDNIPDGVYIEIDSSNEVTNAYQND